MNNVLFSSKKPDWETPIDLFNSLNEIYHFNLDTCANDLNHKCPYYFTEKDNGLFQSWKGFTCWCNPPYGVQIKSWVYKAFCESKDPSTKVVLLLPARTDTSWFHDYIYHYAKIDFIRGRLKFVGANNPAPFPSMLVYYL